jgi:uncharacterized protein (TIGR02266 family)
MNTGLADTSHRMTALGVSHKTVLIADDTPGVRERFTAALEHAGHRAYGARSAAEMLARIRVDLGAIDLVVLDLRLPPDEGVDLVRAVRRIDGGRLPILVFSGTINAATQVRELADLGVSGYVNEFSPEAHILPALAPHLFPDSFNRRGSPRVIMGIPVAYRHANTIAAAVTLNLGKGGIAIRTLTPLEPTARARVRFRLPNSKRDIDTDARVTWSDRQVGMGLEFERLDATDQSAIDEFVDKQRDGK